MSITVPDVLVTVNGANAVVSEAVPGEFQKATQVRVWRIDAASENRTETLLVEGVDYSLVLTPVAASSPAMFTGQVQTTQIVAVTEKIAIMVWPLNEQPTDFIGSPFDPVLYEEQYDAATLRDAATLEIFKRSPRMSLDFVGDQLLLPAPAAGRVLQTREDLLGYENGPTGEQISLAEQYALRAEAAWTLISQSEFGSRPHLLDYPGADPTGNNDSSAAIHAMIADVGYCEVPNGNFVSALTLQSDERIWAVGRGANLLPTGPGARVISLAQGASNCKIYNLFAPAGATQCDFIYLPGDNHNNEIFGNRFTMDYDPAPTGAHVRFGPLGVFSGNNFIWANRFFGGLQGLYIDDFAVPVNALLFAWNEFTTIQHPYLCEATLDAGAKRHADHVSFKNQYQMASDGKACLAARSVNGFSSHHDYREIKPSGPYNWASASLGTFDDDKLEVLPTVFYDCEGVDILHETLFPYPPLVSVWDNVIRSNRKDGRSWWLSRLMPLIGGWDITPYSIASQALVRRALPGQTGQVDQVYGPDGNIRSGLSKDGVRFDAVLQQTVAGGQVTIDPKLGSKHEITYTATITQISVIGPSEAGQELDIEFINSGGGFFFGGWDSNVKIAGAAYNGSGLNNKSDSIRLIHKADGNWVEVSRSLDKAV